MINYQEMKKTVQKKFDDFLGEFAFFAFSDKQFEEGEKKLNAGPDNKLVRIYGGGFLLASKVEDFKALIKECDDIQKQYNKDKKQFKQAFMYELANHEYHIREDVRDTLDALGIDEEDLKNPEFKKLIKSYIKEYMKNINNYYDKLDNQLKEVNS
jgi:hypothetical protein